MRERALIIQLLNLKSVPDYAFITNAVEHENNTLKDMRLKKGDTVTFDLGYCNYKTFGNFCEHGVLFVTRLKENAVKTQIWIASIVYLLFLKLRGRCTYEGKNFTYFMSGIKACLFERTDLFAWFVGHPPVRTSSLRMAMQLELQL